MWEEAYVIENKEEVLHTVRSRFNRLPAGHFTISIPPTFCPCLHPPTLRAPIPSFPFLSFSLTLRPYAPILFSLALLPFLLAFLLKAAPPTPTPPPPTETHPALNNAP